MKFKGTIIITDPCYIIKDNLLKHPKPEDFNLPYSVYSKPYDKYSTPNELAYKVACDKYWEEKSEYDDWEKCEYGSNMKVLGINNYISEPTIYGDWGCNTYQTFSDPKEQLSKINRIYKLLDKEEEKNGVSTSQFKKYKQELDSITADLKNIGSFCADAGMVALFLLDEVLKYNPDFNKWIKDHPWCVTTIEDFDGNAEYYVDEYYEATLLELVILTFLQLRQVFNY